MLLWYFITFEEVNRSAEKQAWEARFIGKVSSLFLQTSPKLVRYHLFNPRSLQINIHFQEEPHPESVLLLEPTPGA